MRVTEKGQVTIPKPIRDKLGIQPGSEVEFVERDHSVFLEKRVNWAAGNPQSFNDGPQVSPAHLMRTACRPMNAWIG